MSYTYQQLIEEFGAKDADYRLSTATLLVDFSDCAGLGIVNLTHVFDDSLLRGALLSIPAGDYKVWIDVAIALHGGVMANELTEEVAYEFWRAWSETDASYDEGMCERKWAGITPAGIKGLGSIYFLAKENGWQGQRSNFWTADERQLAFERELNG